MAMCRIPREIITLQKARHNLCHFHHQQGVTRWLKKRFQSKEDIAVRKPKMRCGFFTVTSAKRDFLLMYVFIRQPESGRVPIEAIMPEASRMPLYQLINDPFGAVLGLENVKKNVRMADLPIQECFAAQT